MSLRLLSLFSALLLSSQISVSWAQTYYWVDENGKRHYGDRVPPKDSKRERKVIDERGYTVETLPSEQSQEQREAAAQQAAAEERRKQAEQTKKQEAASYDRILVSTYENVDQIKRARDDRLTLMDAGILVEVQAHADNQRRLVKYREQEKALLDKGKPVSGKLRENLDDTLRRIGINERNIAELRKQRAEVEAKYNKDIQRFETLTSAAN